MASVKYIVYGYDKTKVESFRNKFNNFTSIILDDNINEDNILDNLVKNCFQGLFLINADTMKKNCMSFSIEEIIHKISSKSCKKEFIIMFNRYQDSITQNYYLGEISENISLFRGFNPGNTDCYYVSAGIISEFQNNEIDIKYKILSRCRKGFYNYYFFNPNLYIFKSENSELSGQMQVLKSNIYKEENKFDLDNYIKNLLSTNTILFWVFIVFFICAVFTVILKISGRLC